MAKRRRPVSVGRLCALAAFAWLFASVFSGCLGLGDSEADNSQSKKPKDAGSDLLSVTDAPFPCQPKDCAGLDADCGQVPDGCGKVLECGSCASGETCGAGGPNRCGIGACNAATCASAGAECGLIGDGCGKALDCGGCVVPDTCGGSGKPNACGCTPKTCPASAECGSVSNGCDGTVSCGICAAGKKCSADNHCIDSEEGTWLVNTQTCSGANNKDPMLSYTVIFGPGGKLAFIDQDTDCSRNMSGTYTLTPPNGMHWALDGAVCTPNPCDLGSGPLKCSNDAPGGSVFFAKDFVYTLSGKNLTLSPPSPTCTGCCMGMTLTRT